MNFTNQELFDKAYKAIIAQGVSSIRDAACSYRGANGTSCAIGHLLSPELRETIEEGDILTRLCDPAVQEFFGYPPDVMSDFSKDTEAVAQAGFLSKLQRAHDSAALGEINPGCDGTDFLSGFRVRMTSLAETYNLTITEV